AERGCCREAERKKEDDATRHPHHLHFTFERNPKFQEKLWRLTRTLSQSANRGSQLHPRASDQCLTTVLVRLSQNFGLINALVHAMQSLPDALAEQRKVFDFEQVIHDEPDGLVGSHPVLRIETRQIHRT